MDCNSRQWIVMRYARPVLRTGGFFGVLLASVAACSDSEPAAAPGMHPDLERIPSAGAAIEIDFADPGHPEHRSVREFVAVGQLEGPQEDVLGFVEDAAITADGDVLALDSRYNNVRRFSADGLPLDQFGGPGQGPAEFASPTGIEVGPDGLIYVSDRGGAIKVFESGDYSLENTIRLGFSPESFCVLGDRIFVRGWRPEGGHIVHVFDLSGTPVRSFGEGYRSENPIVAEQLSSGGISCDAANERVVTWFDMLPRVQAYSVAGDALWAARVSGFRTMRVIERVNDEGKAAVTFKKNEAHDLLLTGLATSGGPVLLQILRADESGPEGVDREFQIHTFSLEPETEGSEYLGTSIPWLHAAQPELLVGSRFDPYPQLLIARR